MKNDKREDVEDGHFAFSEVRIVNEFAEMFPEEMCAASGDGMDRILIGVSCKSRRLKMRAHRMMNTAPHEVG